MAKSTKVARKVAKGSKAGKVATKSKAKAKPVAREYVAKPGTGLEFDDATRITIVAKTNPKRGASAKRFDAYLKRKPKTVGAAIAAGLTRGDIRWDAGKGFIKLAH